MEDLIRRIKERLLEGAYPNEAAISFSVVMPLLRALGWDDSDPEQVMPEYSSGGRRVDFALCGAGKRPSLFIEVKGVGRALEGDRQLFEYAFHEGIPLCLLTDGREWSFFLPSGQGSYDERRVYRLQFNDRSPTECARILTRYLQRTRVKSGEAFEDAMRDYRDIASRREATRNIPAAWHKLVDEPEDLLVELLAEQTETISGFRPTSSEVTRFLRTLKASSDVQVQIASPKPCN
jgi:predicted type IV restriction endonuclease